MPFGKNNKGIIIKESLSQAIGALAASTGIRITPQIGVEEDFRILKSEINAFIKGINSNNDGNRLLLGIADGELSLAEIEEAIELNGPKDRNDRVADEQATRPAWIIGRFRQDGVATVAYLDRKFKQPWTFSDTEGWAFFIYNMDGSTAIDNTNTPTLYLRAKHYGVWVQ